MDKLVCPRSVPTGKALLAHGTARAVHRATESIADDEVRPTSLTLVRRSRQGHFAAVDRPAAALVL